jgi:hypothetical protein
MLRELLAPGDTYEKYTRRCEAMGITPKAFQEWMSFEAKMDHAGRRAGYQPQFERTVEHADASLSR